MRLGVVGASRTARLRAGCYERLHDVTIGGVVTDTDDVDWATNYPDVETLLAEGRLDAVDVCNSGVSQREIVDQCLDAGVGVVCRAPIGDALDEAVAVRDAADESDVPVLIDSIYRFARENREAKEQIGDGELGTPTTVRTTRHLPSVDAPGRDSSGASETLLRRALYRDVATVRWLFGDVERVFTRTATTGPSADQFHAVVLTRFASGAIGHLNVAAGDRYDQVGVRFEYSGTEGRITYDSGEFVPIAGRATSPDRIDVSRRWSRPRPSRDIYERHAKHLVACLRGTADPAVRIADTIETFRTVLAASKSARHETPITVSEVTL